MAAVAAVAAAEATVGAVRRWRGGGAEAVRRWRGGGSEARDADARAGIVQAREEDGCAPRMRSATRPSRRWRRPARPAAGPTAPRPACDGARALAASHAQGCSLAHGAAQPPVRWAAACVAWHAPGAHEVSPHISPYISLHLPIAPGAHEGEVALGAESVDGERTRDGGGEAEGLPWQVEPYAVDALN